MFKLEETAKFGSLLNTDSTTSRALNVSINWTQNRNRFERLSLLDARTLGNIRLRFGVNYSKTHTAPFSKQPQQFLVGYGDLRHNGEPESWELAL
jgi:hypothetical protein